MAKNLKVVLAQLNFTVGAIDSNLKKHIEAAELARDHYHADLIVFPELSLTGYPAEDLLLRASFIKKATDALNIFQSKIKGIHCLVGHPHQTSHGLYNSCSLIHNGIILGRYYKQCLPNYGVFDECRYFIPGNSPCVVPINGIPVGIIICEDLWHSTPTNSAAAQEARIIIIPNASPFESNKHERRAEILAKRAKQANIPILYANCMGGQDELVFDGGSMAVDSSGNICQHAGFFNEVLLPIEIETSSTNTQLKTIPFTLVSEEQRIYECLVLGMRDYIRKNGFEGVILGVSGGIDSALTLAIAVDALGKENVMAVYMPSRYSAPISEEEALAVINNLGVNHQVISIEPAFTSFLNSLAPSFEGKKVDVTEENLQSRCRGVLLMSLSNKLNRLVLTTGNRSELAVGYTTLYGDMVGGYAVLKDVPKTLVYRLANYRNQRQVVIPQRTIDRPPTAELAPNQKDEDTLPAYSILDKILDLYLNKNMGIDDIAAQGFDLQVVEKIVKMIKRSEYKRRQAPPGPHINHFSFIRDWRYPMTSGFKG